MLAVTNIVLPVFALILAGYGLRRLNILGPTACAELNRFVVYLALPALTIDIVIGNPLSALWEPGFLLAFEIAVAAIFFAVLAWRWLATKKLAESAVECTAASYANTGYIGLPLAALTFGADQLAPTIVGATLTVSLNFAFSIVLLEAGTQRGNSMLSAIGGVTRSLAKNPLILAPLAAGVIAGFGWQLPYGVAQSIKLLGGAASPCALVAIGLFLAAGQEKTDVPVSTALVLLKLVVQPALAWYLAFHVFEMPELWAKSAVLLSALPTGTGPFMLAELYKRGEAIASRTILWSTVGSVVTLSVWLALL